MAALSFYAKPARNNRRNDVEHLTLDMLLKLKKAQYVDEGESILLNGNPVAVDEIWVNGSGQMNITTVQEAQDAA